jgi:hypothetical protein
MKNYPKKFLLLSFMLFALFYEHLAQVPINPLFFGQNFHYNSYTTAPTTMPTSGVFSANVWTKLQESGAKMIRVGGRQFNTSSCCMPD